MSDIFLISAREFDQCIRVALVIGIAIGGVLGFAIARIIRR